MQPGDLIFFFDRRFDSYVVVEELIPETAAGEHSNLGTLFFAAGFTVMLALDVSAPVTVIVSFPAIQPASTTPTAIPSGMLCRVTASTSMVVRFMYGALSGVAEPVAAVLTIWAAGLILPALPYLLSFAAGAMVYVVVEELIPEASAGEHSNLGTLFFTAGFTIVDFLG